MIPSNAASSQPVSALDEPVVFIIISEVEAMLNKEKEKALASVICQALKWLYHVDVETKLYPENF